MSPEAKVDIIFGIIEVFIGLATIAVGFASWLQARENRVHDPPAAMGSVVYRMNKVAEQKDSMSTRSERDIQPGLMYSEIDRPVDHEEMKRHPNAKGTRHHESDVQKPGIRESGAVARL